MPHAATAPRLHLAPESAELEAVFASHGVVVLDSFLDGVDAFHDLRRDVAWCAQAMLSESGVDASPDDSPEALVARLYELDPTAPKRLCHLGTQPNDLVSAQRLKYDPRLVAVGRRLLGPTAVLASPAASDTLHAIFPGAAFDRYLLPIHQDFPYLLQSESQITLWIPLSEAAPEIGGIDIWSGSHRLGVAETRTSEHGHLESIVAPEALEQFPEVAVEWKLGDLVVMHALTLHRGRANHSSGRVRLTQLFRYSDLADDSAKRLEWYSKTYPRPGLDFATAYPNCYRP